VSYEYPRLSECIAIPMNNWGFLTSVYFYLVDLKWQESIILNPIMWNWKAFDVFVMRFCNCETSRTSWLDSFTFKSNMLYFPYYVVDSFTIKSNMLYFPYDVVTFEATKCKRPSIKIFDSSMCPSLLTYFKCCAMSVLQFIWRLFYVLFLSGRPLYTHKTLRASLDCTCWMHLDAVADTKLLQTRGTAFPSQYWIKTWHCVGYLCVYVKS
jgi:hypothetical protein